MAEAKPGTLKTITSADYIRANFQPSDRIAVLLRNAARQMSAQRISTAEKIAAQPFQEWMRYKNAQEGFDIYVGMNTLKPTAFRRTKDDILAIRHLYVNGANRLFEFLVRTRSVSLRVYRIPNCVYFRLYRAPRPLPTCMR